MRKQMIVAILPSLLTGVVVCGPIARAYRSDEAPLPEVVQRKGEDRDSSLDRLNTQLRCIEPVDRAERIQRWKAIYELAETQGSGVTFHLQEMAGKTDSEVGRYQRFIAAANIAGFGMPTRIGPNNLYHGMPLKLYIDIQRSIRVPERQKRHIRVHPDIQRLEVIIPPNEDNDLYFQEILWRILEKYDLDFRTESDGTFLIIPGDFEGNQRDNPRSDRGIDEFLAAQRKAEGGDSPLDRLNTLLHDIESVDRIERLYRWMEIRELAEKAQGSGAAFHLREMADETDRKVGRYQRFIAAANVAMFGNPTRFGPNSINSPGMPLNDYINIQRSMVSKSYPKPSIRVHPDIQQLKVVIPPNEDNSLYFQEILWRILEKYDLDFRTEPNGTFLIIPSDPKV